MAYENVNVSKTKKATGIEIGASIEGYVVRFEESNNHENQFNMVMREEGGDEYLLFTSGNLRYMIQDGKIKPGLMTKITRLEDKKTKGKTTTQFEVFQDRARSIDTEGFNAVFDPAPVAAAVNAASVKDQAARLAAGATKRG